MGSGFVLELNAQDRVPGAYLKTVFGVTSASTSTRIKYLLICGMKATGDGDLTEDTEVVDILTDSDADDAWGAGSEGALMARAALSVGGIRIKGCAPSISGATAASVTVTIGGSWTLGGTYYFRIGGQVIRSSFLSTVTETTLAAAIAAYINARGNLPVTATSALGVVTITAKTTGVRGNDLIIYQDTSELPTGMTSTIAGGSAVGNGGKRFSGGVATETMTTMLTTLLAGRYDRIAAAQRDATNLAAWEVQLDTKAGPLVGKMEHIIFAGNGTLAASTSLAQTTLNEQRAQFCWMKDSETPPPVIAATMAALRLQAEQLNPNTNYDGVVMPGIYAQTDLATIPDHSTLVSALDAGLTPLMSTGTVVSCVRAVTTRTLTDAAAIDDATVDVGASATVDEVRDQVKAFWDTQFSVNNRVVQDDPADDAVRPQAGVAYPALWSAEVTRLFKVYEQRLWITQVDTHPVVSRLHPDVPRIVFNAPVVVFPQNHQLEGTLEQTKYSIAA